jgi:hypothetical protein
LPWPPKAAGEWSVSSNDYSILEWQRIGPIRLVIERMPGVWLWNVTDLLGDLPMGSSQDLDTAKEEFKAAWEALKTIGPRRSKGRPICNSFDAPWQTSRTNRQKLPWFWRRALQRLPAAKKGKPCRGSIRGIAERAGQVVLEVYFRDAQAYMLISMPTDTSTIFGVFQLIRFSQ